MQVNELIRKAQTVVDCDGNKKAVQLDYATWEELLAFLSDRTGDRTTQDRSWITEKLNEIYAEEDSSLDPGLAAMQWATLKAADDSNELLRPIGLAAGEFTIPDDFDDPLPEEVIRDFEGL